MSDGVPSFIDWVKKLDDAKKGNLDFLGDKLKDQEEESKDEE